MSQINQKLRRLFDITGLYLCGPCRRELKIYYDVDAIVKKLNEIKNGRK